ncbi:hypothetical protein ACBY01_00350 [Sphingomonas sp. ac-8]|uniref:hypothetical protein n=1 Tax=Sphingomonas sp. ac-8 TaxID=3242977 RepID=UPI003A805F98
MITRFLIAAAAAALAMPAVAAGPLALDTQVLSAQRAAAADGTTRITLVKPSRIVPGDAVVFVLRYRNTGSQPLADVVLANPLPASLAYRGPQQNSPAPELSVDGKTYGALAALRVKTAEGGTRPATADDVTSVRWRLPSPITAGSTGEFAFQAVVR